VYNTPIIQTHNTSIDPTHDHTGVRTKPSTKRPYADCTGIPYNNIPNNDLHYLVWPALLPCNKIYMTTIYPTIIYTMMIYPTMIYTTTIYATVIWTMTNYW
jgi:hypothetical protein